MNPKSIFLFLAILFLIKQVSAHKCYTCSSELDEDCIAHPKQEKFEFECLWFNSTLFRNMESSPQLSMAFDGLYKLEPRVIDFQCATAILTNVTSAKKSVLRGCVPKHVNNESIKIVTLAVSWMQLDVIRRCAGDLCNNIDV